MQVYLDNNATTPLDPEVVEEMLKHFRDDFGNASSIHSYGQRARAAVEEARQKVAALIGAQPREIVFTSGGTEADNTALRGIATWHRKKGNHIITNTIEHPAVLRTCQQLEKEGFQVTYVPVDNQGIVRLEDLRKAIKPQTILISVMHVNNEVGTIQPVDEIARIARENKILFHTDAVQSVGKIKVDVKALRVDLLTLSGHKIHGPKGVGALYVRQGTRMNPLLYGGSHERNRRAGTENVPGIVGLGKACELAAGCLDDFQGRVRFLRDKLETEILRRIPDIVLNGNPNFRAPHVSNITFRYIEGEGLLVSLDFKGIAVSTGAACSSGSVEPSHVLTAMGRNSELASGAIRFSLSRMNIEKEVDYLLETLPGIIDRMREMSPLYRAAK
ncbi:MAG: cysteine desulfurase NifS [Acidobacteria bacterium]|nr:cysteine desulfurase NifS [Acidobacteriota bacterium]